MPTLISKKLSDLQAERENLTRYERQIVQERDAILASVRGHLDQLDREIVRLGGPPQNQESAVGVLSPRNDNGSQNVRGRSRKVEAEVPWSEKIADASSSSNQNGRFRDQDGKENRSSGNKKRSKCSLVVSDNKTIGEAWTCECGTHMAAGRARCGACRRWKGGKRLTKWTIKKDSSTSNNTVEGIADKGSSSSICGISKAFNAYRNLPPAEQKSVLSDGSTLLTYPRVEIEDIMSDMISAIEFDGPANTKMSGDNCVVSMTDEDGASNKRKRGRPSINPAVSTSDSDDGSVTKPPRKRGRPRKEQLPNSVLDTQHVESSIAAVGTESSASNISPRDMTSCKIQEIAEQPIRTRGGNDRG